MKPEKGRADELEMCVKMVLKKGLATGHADNHISLMEEVLFQYSELQARHQHLRRVIKEAVE